MLDQTSPDSHLFRAARIHADREALRLFAWASTIYPNNSADFLNLLAEQVLDSGLNFAINARKVIELSGVEDSRIASRRWEYKLNDGHEIEDSFRRAVNGIIHSHSNKLHFSSSPMKIFADSDGNDAILLHFVIKTEKYPEVYVDIFGLAWTFLSFLGPRADQQFGK